MSKPDFYETLGVNRNVDAKALKSAYRKLAMKYHPDQNPGDAAAEAKFKEISEAYQILSDENQRAAYDRYGHAAFENGMGGGSGGRGPFGGADPSDIFESIFGQVFGGGGRRRTGPARGSDLRYDMTISLEESFSGKSTTINVPTAVICHTCSGSGAKPGTQPQTCNTCGGAGKVRAQQGFFTMERTCVTCSGRGQVITDPCETCLGAGTIHKDRELKINIPEGVESGMQIRLSGEGEAGKRGGPHGDLYIFIEVEDHDIFEREGTHLYCRTPVPMTTAALGGEIEIPTMTGARARVSIPEGAQTGRKLRLRGKGMPNVHGGSVGDLYIEVFVETPRKMTARQKEILREFAEQSGEGCSPESEGFLGKIKRFWDDLTEGEDKRAN